jgi:hypothetical protein
MLNHKTIKTILTITALCLISLARAEEKEGSKIEPKLVYEKHFDFEIEQGKIGDDGSIFPTIFVTKDNRIIFYDVHGRIAKSIKLNKGETGTLSKDAKYLVIQNIPEDWGQENTEKKWQVFDQAGNIIAKGSYNEPYAIFLQLVRDKTRIFMAKGTTERVIKLEFYDKAGILSNSITEESLSQYITGTNKYYALGVNEVSSQYILARLENPRINEERGSWLVVFDTDGKIIWKKQIREHYILSATISCDGRYITYVPSSNEYFKIIDRKKDTAIKFKDPSPPGFSAPDLRFINTNWLYYISPSKHIYIFNLKILDKMQQITPYFQWCLPKCNSITHVAISEDTAQYLGVVDSQNTVKVFSLNNSEELFALQYSCPVIDIKLNAMEKMLYILNTNSIKIYKW